MKPEALPGTRQQIAALIPHQGTMCLLDAVIEASEQHIVCITRSHARADNPLRHSGRLSAIALCEYGAQAAAVHGGLAARASRQKPLPGLLVALRDVQLLVAEIDPDGTLEVRAERVLATASAWQYQFAVSRGGQRLASGRATVVLTE